jgi:hypothetical protein
MSDLGPLGTQANVHQIQRENTAALSRAAARKAPRFFKSDFRNLRNLQDPKLRPRKGICPTDWPTAHVC